MMIGCVTDSTREGKVQRRGRVQHAAVQTNRSKAGHVRLGSKPSSLLD
jgi:hypothetical protein